MIGYLNSPELIVLKVHFRGKLIDASIYAILLKNEQDWSFLACSLSVFLKDLFLQRPAVAFLN